MFILYIDTLNIIEIGNNNIEDKIINIIPWTENELFIFTDNQKTIKMNINDSKILVQKDIGYDLSILINDFYIFSINKTLNIIYILSTDNLEQIFNLSFSDFKINKTIY